MKNSSNDPKSKAVYSTPAFRLIDTALESSILSNLEPIGGVDDPDIDW